MPGPRHAALGVLRKSAQVKMPQALAMGVGGAHLPSHCAFRQRPVNIPMIFTFLISDILGQLPEGAQPRLARFE